jgi:hypothetical protein
MGSRRANTRDLFRNLVIRTRRCVSDYSVASLVGADSRYSVFDFVDGGALVRCRHQYTREFYPYAVTCHGQSDVIDPYLSNGATQLGQQAAA